MVLPRNKNTLILKVIPIIRNAGGKFLSKKKKYKQNFQFILDIILVVFILNPRQNR